MRRAASAAAMSGDDAKLESPPPGESDPLVSDASGKRQITRRSQWYHTAFVVMAEVMGAGILGLPYATSRLGLGLGLGASVVCGLAAAYAGLLLARAKHDFAVVSDAESYDDMATALVGPRFGSMTRLLIASNWAMLLPFFLLSAADSIRLIFPHAPLHTSHWVLLLGVVLLVPSQLRTLHELSFLSLPSVLAILVAVVVVLAHFISATSSHFVTAASTTAFTAPPVHHHHILEGQHEAVRRLEDAHNVAAMRSHLDMHGHSTPALGLGPPSARVSLWPSHDLSIFGAFGEVGAFTFAYMGHSMFLELMREMEDSHHFGSIALPFANVVMVLCYTGTALCGVATFGSAVSEFLPDSMEDGGAKRFVGVLLTFHMLVSFLVTAQPLCRKLHAAAFPATADVSTQRAAVHWLVITICTIAFAVFVAVAVPFFEPFQTLLGALAGAPTLFGYPALFYLLAARQSKAALHPADAILCWTYLALLTPLFLVFGTTHSVITIVDRWAQVEVP